MSKTSTQILFREIDQEIKCCLIQLASNCLLAFAGYMNQLESIFISLGGGIEDKILGITVDRHSFFPSGRLSTLCSSLGIVGLKKQNLSYPENQGKMNRYKLQLFSLLNFESIYLYLYWKV